MGRCLGERRKVGGAPDRKERRSADFLGGKGAPLKGGVGCGLTGQVQPHLSPIFFFFF